MQRFPPGIRRGVPFGPGVAAAAAALLTLIIVLAPPGAPVQGKAAPAAVGTPAPAFTAQDLAGRTVTLAGLRGKVVYLQFQTLEPT